MNLFELMANSIEPGTPVIVQQAIRRIADRFKKPPEPIMSQEEFDKLPKWERSILICNMPKCGNMVCTHGMLCVDHTGKL